MITLLFSVLMIMFIAEVLMVAFRLAWGILKILATIVGVIIVGAVLFGAGMYIVVFLGLIIAGIAGLVATAAA